MPACPSSVVPIPGDVGQFVVKFRSTLTSLAFIVYVVEYGKHNPATAHETPSGSWSIGRMTLFVGTSCESRSNTGAKLLFG
jgi:hypothetical protein